MRNIRVAVLDTGVAREIKDERIKYKKRIYLDYYDEKVVIEDATTDMNGHGTSVVNTIWNTFSNVDIYMLDILGIAGNCSGKVLEEALAHVCDLNVDIVALCASVVIPGQNDRIRFLCERLHKQGKVIVASVENGKETSAIANYKDVIGVIGRSVGYKYAFSRNMDIQMCCDDTCHIVESKYGLSNFFKGNSRATAIATGIIAQKLYSRDLKVDDIIDILELEADSRFDDVDSIIDKRRGNGFMHYRPAFDKEKENYLVENEEKYQRFIYALCEYIEYNDVSEVRTTRLWDINGGIFWRKIEDLFTFIYENYGVKMKSLRFDRCAYAYDLYEEIFG